MIYLKFLHLPPPPLPLDHTKRQHPIHIIFFHHTSGLEKVSKYIHVI